MDRRELGGGTHRGRRDSAAIEWRMDGEHQGNKFEVRGSEHYQFLKPYRRNSPVLT